MAFEASGYGRSPMIQSFEPCPEQRLDFELPEFARVSWVSEIARDVWRPRLQRITAAMQEIEWLTVAEQIRPCCWVLLAAGELISRRTQWSQMGLTGLPIATFQISSEGRLVRSANPGPDQTLYHRVALGRPGDVLSFQEACAACDHVQVARNLGYPPCCAGFFAREWSRGGRKDLTWLMAVGSDSVRVEDRTAVVHALPACNLMWRQLNIRAVGHLPCCFTCAPTQALMDPIFKIGVAAGYADEMHWLVELLSWPGEWSALHGIAEFKSPVLKLCSNTDATAVKYTVHLNGTGYPLEGARGVHFPYLLADQSE
jgi:hypothetical protein